MLHRIVFAFAAGSLLILTACGSSGSPASADPTAPATFPSPTASPGLQTWTDNHSDEISRFMLVLETMRSVPTVGVRECTGFEPMFNNAAAQMRSDPQIPREWSGYFNAFMEGIESCKVGDYTGADASFSVARILLDELYRSMD